MDCLTLKSRKLLWVSFLDIMEFMKVTNFKLNYVCYFWQIVVGNRGTTAVLDWFGSHHK
jgi:hypothetical protein